MRTASIVASILISTSASSQMIAELSLPRDNGSTVSFESRLPISSDDPCPIQCITWALAESKMMLWTRQCPSQGWMDGELLFSISEHEVTCLVEVSAVGDSVRYQFSCYRVDGIRLDEWLSRNPGIVAERIKSTVFAETVLSIVEIRKAAST